MMQQFRLIVRLCVFLACSRLAAFAQPFEDARILADTGYSGHTVAGESLNLLNDRLLIASGTGFKLSETHLIKGKKPSIERRQYLTVPEEGDNLTMEAKELFALAGPGVKEEIEIQILLWDQGAVSYSIREVRKDSATGMELYIIKPAFVPEKDHARHTAVIVRHPDNSLIMLDFKIQAKSGSRDAEAWDERVEALISSLKPGPRAIGQAGDYRFYDIRKEKAVEVSLPVGYGFVQEVEANQRLVVFYKLRPLNDDQSKLNMYLSAVGGQFLRGFHIPQTKSKERKLKILGKKVVLKEFSHDNVFLAETGLNGPVFLNFDLVTDSKETYNEMIGIMTGLRLP